MILRQNQYPGAPIILGEYCEAANVPPSRVLESIRKAGLPWNDEIVQRLQRTADVWQNQVDDLNLAIGRNAAIVLPGENEGRKRGTTIFAGGWLDGTGNAPDVAEVAPAGNHLGKQLLAKGAEIIGKAKDAVENFVTGKDATDAPASEANSEDGKEAPKADEKPVNAPQAAEAAKDIAETQGKAFGAGINPKEDATPVQAEVVEEASTVAEEAAPDVVTPPESAPVADEKPAKADKTPPVELSDDPRLVAPCSVCKQGKGMPCVKLADGKPSGEPTKGPHPARVKASKTAREAVAAMEATDIVAAETPAETASKPAPLTDEQKAELDKHAQKAKADEAKADEEAADAACAAEQTELTGDQTPADAKAAKKHPELGIVCDKCGAKEGMRCIGPKSRKPINVIHAKRKDDWKALHAKAVEKPAEAAEASAEPNPGAKDMKPGEKPVEGQPGATRVTLADAKAAKKEAQQQQEPTTQQPAAEGANTDKNGTAWIKGEDGYTRPADPEYKRPVGKENLTPFDNAFQYQQGLENSYDGTKHEAPKDDAGKAIFSLGEKDGKALRKAYDEGWAAGAPGGTDECGYTVGDMKGKLKDKWEEGHSDRIEKDDDEAQAKSDQLTELTGVAPDVPADDGSTPFEGDDGPQELAEGSPNPDAESDEDYDARQKADAANKQEQLKDAA